MEKAVHETVEKNSRLFNKDDEHRILIDVSRGLLSIYEDVDIRKGPNVIIEDFPLRWTVQNCSHLYDQGLNLCITSQRAIPAHLMDPKIKNRSRLFYLMANIEVSMMKGNDNWALLLDTNGFIAEGTGSNFFMVKNNVIFTPEYRNILRGISMNTVINDLAPSLGLKVIKKNIEPKFLERPFTTNFQQLQSDVDTQKIIEEFRYQAFDIEGEGECDPNLQFGYSFYLKDDKLTNLEDKAGTANTIKLVAKRIEYTINGTDGSTGGFVRKITGVKRLS